MQMQTIQNLSCGKKGRKVSPKKRQELMNDSRKNSFEKLEESKLSGKNSDSSLRKNEEIGSEK